MCPGPMPMRPYMMHVRETETETETETQTEDRDEPEDEVYIGQDPEDYRDDPELQRIMDETDEDGVDPEILDIMDQERVAAVRPVPTKRERRYIYR